MTVGTRTIDLRFPIQPDPDFGVSTVGQYKVKSWSGGDAIDAQHLRESYPEIKRPRAPKIGRTGSRIALPPQDYWMKVTDQFVDILPVRYSGNSYDSWAAPQPVPAPDIAFPSWGMYDVKKEYKLISKIHDQLYGSGFSPAVFIAEGHQALSMIGNAAQRVGSALRRLRARDPHGVLEALGLEPNDKFSRGLRDRRKALSSSWLEVNYGWMPLLSDAEEGAKWLAHALEAQTPGRVRARSTWSIESKSTLGIPVHAAQFQRRIDIYQLQIVGNAVATTAAYVPTMATVASVAWEKLPYSFVVDWFVPIGSYLAALRTSQSIISGTFVRSIKVDTVYLDMTFSPSVTVKGDWLVKDGTRYSVTEMYRTVSKELSVPTPVSYLQADKMLEYKSWQHAANATALLLGGRTPERLTTLLKKL